MERVTWGGGAGPCAECLVQAVSCFPGKLRFSAKIDTKIILSSQNWPQNRIYQPKLTLKSYFSAKIDPKIIFFSQNWPQNHIFQPKLIIHTYIVCKYLCNKQTYCPCIKCLASPRLILDTTHKGGARCARATTVPMGAAPAGPTGAVVFPFVCGVQNQPWAR